MQDQPKAAAAALAPTSPFLPSDANELPNLALVDMPNGAVVEACQQVVERPVDLPMTCMRDADRINSKTPKDTASLAFRQTWEAFASARRMVSPTSSEQAEKLLIAENKELEDFGRGVVPADGSLACRGFAVHLVIPTYCRNSSAALHFLDGMAALSDGRTSDGKPITTVARFTAYADRSSFPVERLLSKECLGQGVMEGISVVLRWTVKEASGGCRTMTEFAPLRATTLTKQETTEFIQSTIVSLAFKHEVALPPPFFMPVKPATPKYYERQIVAASNELATLLNKEDDFAPSEAMVSVGCTRIVPVPGVCVRMSPVACGLAGVTSNSCFHALLLCADGQEKEAREYAIQHREGLPPPSGVRAECMFLHTLAVQPERVFLNDMVSLYGPNGKPGESIQSPGTWVWRSSTAIVPIGDVMRNFFVMSCAANSLVPKRQSLAPFMERSFQHAIDLYHRVFGDSDLKKITSCAPRPGPVQAERNEVPDSDEHFVLLALGIDLTSRRLCLGEAISYLMEKRGPSELINMLVAVSGKVGLSASLNDAFGGCVASIKSEELGNIKHDQEVNRLKRIADAALVLNCSRKAKRTEKSVSATQVRKLMKALELQPSSPTRIDGVDYVPRGAPISHSAAYSVMEACGVRESPHTEEIQNVLDTHEDIIVALSKAMQICTIDSPEAKSFILIHGHNMHAPSLFETEAGGGVRECGIGNAFEAECACIIVVKFRASDSCLVTPLVRRRAAN